MLTHHLKCLFTSYLFSLLVFVMIVVCVFIPSPVYATVSEDFRHE